MKNEIINRELKNEEKYLFHRIIGSHLSEAVANLFEQESNKMDVEHPIKNIEANI